MNITLIFGQLAFLGTFYTSVQGQRKVWPVSEAKVGDKTYKTRVSLERSDDGKTWNIHAIPKNSSSNVPEVVHGPFELRGFGPYSMLITRVWLNTRGYVAVTFSGVGSAREFYYVSNPHHTRSFPNDFAIKRLVLLAPDGNPKSTFGEYVPKALDIFVLETESGADSRARSYVVHNMEGNQEPYLIFHSLETDMIVDGDSMILSITPRNSSNKYLFRIEFEEPSTARQILDAYTTLKLLGCKFDLRYLEALPRNTYPSRPPQEQVDSPNTGNQ